MRWSHGGLVLSGVALHALLWGVLINLLGVPWPLGVQWVAIMSLWVAVESLARADTGQADAGDTASWFGIATLLGILVLGLVTASTAGAHPGGRCGGLALVAAGACVRVRAIAALGEGFSARPVLRGVPLRSGGYGFMRHPAELGLILCVLGSSLFLDSAWAVLGSLTVFPLVTHWRVLGEERALMMVGAREYEAYLREVPRWGWRGRTKKPSQGL